MLIYILYLWIWCFKMKILSIIIILFFTLTLQAEDIAVVVSSKFKSDTLQKSDVNRIFLAKSNRINNKKIKIIELKNSSYKDVFYKKVLNKTQSQLHSYWSRLIFTGKANPPKQVESLDILLKKMAENKLIVTYLPVSMVTSEMKILYTLKN